jgi:hypothetical protein
MFDELTEHTNRYHVKITASTLQRIRATLRRALNAAWRARRSDRETLGPYLLWPRSQPTIEYWQLELRLNPLGEAFMIVDDFAQRGQRLLAVPGGP